MSAKSSRVQAPQTLRLERWFSFASPIEEQCSLQNTDQWQVLLASLVPAMAVLLLYKPPVAVCIMHGYCFSVDGGKLGTTFMSESIATAACIHVILQCSKELTSTWVPAVGGGPTSVCVLCQPWQTCSAAIHGIGFGRVPRRLNGHPACSLLSASLLYFTLLYVTLPYKLPGFCRGGRLLNTASSHSM